MTRKFLFAFIYLIALTGCETALEQPVTNKTVQLLAPANNVVSGETNQTFYWEILGDATQYQLQVVSPGFDSIVKLIVDTTISNNQFTQTLGQGRFQWRVKALNNSSSTSFSEAWNLIIE